MKVDPEQAREVESRFQVVKRWVLRHKIETTAVIVIIVGIVFVATSLVGGGGSEASTVPPSGGNTTTGTGTDTNTPPSDNIFPSDNTTSDPTDKPSSKPSSILKSPIMTELALLTDPAILFDESSPQYKAAEWLISWDPIKLNATSPNLGQRYALATLYTATGGSLTSTKGWKACGAVPPENQSSNTTAAGVQCIVRDGKVICANTESFETCNYTDRFQVLTEGKRFMSAATECEWYGVECDDQDSVIKINVVDNELTGSIPVELALLTELKRIDFSLNNIGGSIPPELAQLVSLQEFLLSENMIGGPIPLGFYQLVAMTLFELEDNKLTGEIASDIGNWSNLRMLYLDRNELRGTIPTTIGLLEMAERISLHDNLLTGAIPTELSELWSLKTLKLDHNYLVGKMPDGLCELELERLDADCLPSEDDGDVAVTCSCCTQCCAIEEVRCVNITTPGMPPNDNAAPFAASSAAPFAAPFAAP